MAIDHPERASTPPGQTTADGGNRQGALLRAYLADQDHECPSCSYNVRGLKTDVCPECNQRLVLRLALAEPRLAWFVVGLVGLSMGLGVHTLLAGWFVTMRWGRGVGPPLKDFVLLVAMAMFHAAAVWIWTRNRGRVTRAAFAERWVLVVLCFLTSVGTFAIFANTAR